jgi:hypothetical protein
VVVGDRLVRAARKPRGRGHVTRYTLVERAEDIDWEWLEARGGRRASGQPEAADPDVSGSPAEQEANKTVNPPVVLDDKTVNPPAGKTVNPLTVLPNKTVNSRAIKLSKFDSTDNNSTDKQLTECSAFGSVASRARDPGSEGLKAYRRATGFNPVPEARRAVGLISLKPRPGTSALIVLPNAKPSDGKPAPARSSSRPAGDLVAQTPGTHNQVARTPTLGGPATNTRCPSHLEQEPVTRITNKNHEGAHERAPARPRGPVANRRQFSALVEYARARLVALPNSVQREAIDRAVTAGDAAMPERWKLCVDAWRLAGHSPVNIVGCLTGSGLASRLRLAAGAGVSGRPGGVSRGGMRGSLRRSGRRMPSRSGLIRMRRTVRL